MTKSIPLRWLETPESPDAPHTLATLAAALVTCQHPKASRASVDVTVPASERVNWCAACGALRADERPEASWQSARLTSLLTKKQFEQFALLLHSIHQLHSLTKAEASPAAVGSPAHMHLRRLRASLSELSRLPLVRDLDRLEEAIAKWPPTPQPLRP